MKTRTTRTGSLKEYLVREMSDLRIPIGGRLPSEAELMELFSLSRSSVRQVLSELTIEGWVDRQQGRGTFHVAGNRELHPSHRTMLVGVWFNWPSGPLFGPIAQGIREELSNWGYHAVFEDGGLQVGAEAAGVNTLVHKALDGFIVAPSSNPRDDHSPLFELIDRGVPLVLVDHVLAGYDADLVTTAGELGAEEIVDHLVSLGHRRIGFVGIGGVWTMEERLRGFQLTLRRHGIAADDRWVQIGENVGLDCGREAAQALLDLPPEVRPTAIFGANDVIAETVAIVARERSLRVPEDLLHPGLAPMPRPDGPPPRPTGDTPPPPVGGAADAEAELELELDGAGVAVAEATEAPTEAIEEGDE